MSQPHHQTPENVAAHDVKALQAPDAGHHQMALDKMQKDAHVMGQKGHESEQKYWDSFKSKGGDSLPDLKITSDHGHVSKVEDKSGHVMYDTHAVGKGEGAYQALRREGKSHKEALDEAHNIEKSTGLKTFHQGDTINADGSVTRHGKAKADGSYSDTTYKNGTETTAGFNKDHKQVSEVRQNKDGSRDEWHKNADDTTTSVHQKDKDHKVEVKRDKDGQLISRTTDETGADGARTISEVDRDGSKLTKTYDAQHHQTSAIKLGADGSRLGWHLGPDGKPITVDEPAPTPRPTPAPTPLPQH